MPRRPVRRSRSSEEYERIYRQMPVALRTKAREFFETLTVDELEELDVSCEDVDEMERRDTVLLAEEMFRREAQEDPQDEVLAESQEDYGVTDA